MRKLAIWTTVVVVLLIAMIGYSHWLWGGRGRTDELWAVRGGIAEHGRDPLIRHGCGACHVIDGIGRARGRVGPKLEDIHEQIYLAGVMPNTAENMVAWIMFPQRVNPKTAMPNLDVTEQDARHMAAYLYMNQ
jgi:cytochrome c